MDGVREVQLHVSGRPAVIQTLTDRGIGELRARMPYADLSGFDHDRQVSSVPDLFTVDLLTRYIAWKLSQGVAAAPAQVEPDAVTVAASLP